MTHCVVSAGLTRLLAGMGLGADQLRIVTMVVLVVDARFTSPASGSVPVFTDQRSTPHWARSSVARETDNTASRRDLSDLFMRQASKKNQFESWEMNGRPPLTVAASI